MESQLNKFNPLNLKFEFPKTSSLKFETIELDLIDTCQLKCPMCLRQERINKKFTGKIQFNDIKSFFNIIKTKYSKNFDIKLVRLIGTLSEPTLYPELLELIEFINDFGASVQISTNGNLKNDLFWKKLNKTLSKNSYNEILFAIEGSTQQCYEFYRKMGNLETVFKNLDLCSKDRLFKLGWQFIKFEHNQNEYPKIYELISTKIDFIEIFNCNEPENFNSKINPRKDIIQKFYKKRKYINEEIFNNNKNIIKNKDIGCVCKQFGEIFISTNGNIWPCTNLYENEVWLSPQPNINNIKNINLIDYLNTIIENRYKNKECFKACSMFGHKLEKEFLRKRLII